MPFSRIFRPALRHVTTAFSSSPCCFCYFRPVVSSNVAQVCNVDFGFQTRGYAKKQELIHLKPLKFDYSEDVFNQEPLDPKELVFKYKNIPEVNELPDDVKKIFTLEYATSKEKLEHRSALMLEKISGLLGPGPCLEKEICYLTVKIRNLIPYIQQHRMNKKHKSYLIERIAKRKKLLRALKKLDYDRFKWLLLELQITATPVDPYAYHAYSKNKQTSRIKRKAYIETYRIRREKLAEVRKDLKEKRQKFYDIKKKMLKEIDNDIKKYELNKAEILETFQKRMEQQRQEAEEATRKLSKVQRYKLEMRKKKEKNSKVF